MGMVSDQHGTPTVEHRVCFVGLVEDRASGYAFDCFTRFECFKVHGDWSIGPMQSLGDLAEWRGWLEHCGRDAGMEMAYEWVREYLVKGAVPDTVLVRADGEEREIVTWCEDEPVHEQRVTEPWDMVADECHDCGLTDEECECYRFDEDEGD